MPPRGTTMHVNEDHIAEIYNSPFAIEKVPTLNLHEVL